MKAIINKEKLDKGIKVLNTVINNALVKTDNSYLTIVNNSSNGEIYLLGFGLNRQVSSVIGICEDSDNTEDFIYQIKKDEIERAIPFIEEDEIIFNFGNKNHIDLKAGIVELTLLNHFTEGINGDVEDALEKINSFSGGFEDDATDYINRLNILDKIIVVGGKVDDDVTISLEHMYTNMTGVPIDSRLAYKSTEEYRLDKSTIKTILEMAKGQEDLSDVIIDVNDVDEEFTCVIGDSMYILGNIDTYFMGKDGIYDEFNKEGEIVLPYKEFIKYLKLATIYLDNLTEVYLEIKDNKMNILPDTAFVGKNLTSNDNVQGASYSKAEIDVMSDKDLTLRVTGNVIVTLLSNLTDVADVNNFIMEYGEDSVKFVYDFGETVLGANVEMDS